MDVTTFVLCGLAVDLGTSSFHRGLGVILKSHDLLQVMVMSLGVNLSLTTALGSPGGLERPSRGLIGPLGWSW